MNDRTPKGVQLLGGVAMWAAFLFACLYVLSSMMYGGGRPIVFKITAAVIVAGIAARLLGRVWEWWER